MALLAEREPLYLELADLVVDTGQGNIKAVVASILKKLAA